MVGRVEQKEGNRDMKKLRRLAKMRATTVTRKQPVFESGS